MFVELFDILDISQPDIDYVLSITTCLYKY